MRPHRSIFIFDTENAIRLPISFTQAALGARVKIPTLEGECEVIVPKAMQHGRVVKVSGQGLPNLRSGRRGDLLVQLLIEIPQRLTAKQETLLREYAETEDHSVLPETQGFWNRVKEFIAGKED